MRFGLEHLRYEVARRMAKCGPSPWPVWAGTGLSAPGRRLPARPGWCRPVGLLVLALVPLVSVAPDAMQVSEQDFDRLWRRWREVHGTPARRRSCASRSAAHRSVDASREPDLQDYSFDRAVICDRARTVDLLLANNFHFENNCAVLAVNGYPPRAFETVLAMLRRNPRLQVFALHDATAAGCTLAHRLANARPTGSRATVG